MKSLKNQYLARVKEGKTALEMLTSKPRGNIPLGRSRHRWEENIKINLKGTCINTKNCTDGSG